MAAIGKNGGKMSGKSVMMDTTRRLGMKQEDGMDELEHLRRSRIHQANTTQS